MWGASLAVVVAWVCASVAPAPWPERAVLTLRDGGAVEELAIRLDEPVDARLGRWSVRFRPPMDVELTRDGAPVRLGEVRVGLRLPHGEDTLVPTVEARGDTLVARRTPPRRGRAMLAILGFVVVIWVGEVVPLWVGALAVPVLLGMARIGSAREVLAPFFHPVIALFLAGFALARAMAQTGLDRRLALTVIARSGQRPVRLYGAMLAVTALASMFMSNTAAAAMLVPVAMAVGAPLGEEGRGFRKAMVLGIAYAATLGGVGSAIGTPANPLAIAFLEESGHAVGFVGWFAYGLPMVVLFLPVMGAWVWWSLGGRPPERRFRHAVEEARRAREALPPWSGAERQVAVIAALTVLGWATDRIHGLHPGLVGLGGMIALHLAGRFGKDDLAHLDWAALLTFGGGLSLGAQLAGTGMADWLATRLEGWGALPPAVGVAGVALFALALTAVASNTASAAILIPLAVPLASVLEVDPVRLVMVVAIASSIDFALVIGTPPTMVAYSTGMLRAGEVFRVGVALDLLGLAVLLTVVAAVWSAMGLV